MNFLGWLKNNFFSKIYTSLGFKISLKFWIFGIIFRHRTELLTILKNGVNIVIFNTESLFACWCYGTLSVKGALCECAFRWIKYILAYNYIQPKRVDSNIIRPKPVWVSRAGLCLSDNVGSSTNNCSGAICWGC